MSKLIFVRLGSRYFVPGAVVVGTVLISSRAFAQQPFQDAKGEGTLFLQNGGGFAQFGVTDSTVKLGYLHDVSRGNEPHPVFYGAEISGKLNGKSAGLFKEDTAQPDATIKLNFGRKYIFTKRPLLSTGPVKPRPAPSAQPDNLLPNGSLVPRKDGLLILVSNPNPGPSTGEPAAPLALLELVPSDIVIKVATTSGELRSLGPGAYLPSEKLKALKELKEKRTTPGPIEVLAPSGTLIPISLSDKDRVLWKVTDENGILVNPDPGTLLPLTPEVIDAKPGIEKMLPLGAFVPVGQELQYFDPATQRFVTAPLNSLKSTAAVISKPSVAPASPPKDTGDDIKNDFDSLVFQVGYSRARYTLYDPAQPFSQQISKRNFNGPSASIIYNRLIQGNKLFGLSFGAAQSNNANLLKQVDIQDSTTVVDGGTTREVGTSSKALLGSFARKNRVFVNSDFVIYPRSFNSRVGINLFTRSELNGFDKGISPGVGLFLAEKGNPTNVLGGLSLSSKDGERKLSLVTGFNFD